MASWLTIALVLILVGLLFGVGLFVEAGKVILLVILALLLIGVLAGAFYRRRPAT
jgi:cbb3-type cytochrome oxidase subunit 3